MKYFLELCNSIKNFHTFKVKENVTLFKLQKRKKGKFNFLNLLCVKIYIFVLDRLLNFQ